MPPRLTIAYSYYEEPHHLERQIKLWEDYPPGVEIFVTDDGSSKYPAFDILKDVYFPYGADIQLWRVTRDLGFNSHGCRNLAATHASTDMVFFLDMDMSISPGDVGSLRRISYQDNSLYFFNCYVIHKKQFHTYPGHLNTFGCTKNTFWNAGGYDESYTGYHHGDREFHSRLELGTKKNNLGITTQLYRGGRRAVIDPGIPEDKTVVYDDDNMLIRYREPLPDLDTLTGTVPQKLNFPYLRLF